MSVKEDEDEGGVSAIDVANTRAPATDVRRRYRPVPADFEELWPRHGWSEAALVWHAHPRNIASWIDELGRDRMVLARKRYLDAQRVIKGRARRKRYVLGRTLNAPIAKGSI